MTTRWIMSFQPNPLPVFGPAGTAGVIQATEAMLEPDIRYRLEHHDDLTWAPSADVTEADGGPLLDDGAVRVTAAPTDHAPVRPTLGYRVEDGGASVVIAGDTVPCEGLDELCAGADMLVHTVIRRDLLEPLNIPRLNDVFDYHSTVEDAAAPQRGAVCAPLSSPTSSRHRGQTRSRGGRSGRAPISTARSSWPATSSPSTSAPSRTPAVRAR